MGTKRWLAAVFVSVLIIALLVILLFQAGADDRLVASMLPGLEKRFGARITYREMDASLTAVTIEDVAVYPQSGQHPFVVIERLVVNVRIGPLLFGDLEITGLKLDGLEARMGDRVEGASFADWLALSKRTSRFGDSATGDGSDPSNTALPEIYLTSSRMKIDNGRFHLGVQGISGWIGSDKRTALDIDQYDLRHLNRPLFKGTTATIQLQPDKQLITASLEQPQFELLASSERVAHLLTDARDVLRLSTDQPTPEPAEASDAGTDTAAAVEPADPRNRTSDDSWKRLFETYDIRLAISEASGKVINADKPSRVLTIDDVTAKVTSVDKKEIAIRANGSLPGTNAAWGLGVTWPLAGDPKLVLEVPDLPLHTIGELLMDNDVVQWNSATADGKITVAFLKQGRQLGLTGRLAVSGLGIHHERLAAAPLLGFDVNADYKVTYDRQEKVFHLERFLLSRGLARLTLRGDVAIEKKALDLTLSLPPTPCQHLLRAVPPEMATRISDVRLDGQMALDLRMAVDSTDPEATTLEVDLDNRCRFADMGKIPAPNYFRGPFSYTAYTETGDSLRLVTGPGTDRWAPLMAISPYVIEALMTTEDGKFWRHKGVTVPELRRAIELNLKKDALRHGASTITMQLAKNLFLTRERTVARKLQELFMVWYLETNFTKEEILELYLNAIEFGPSVYGIHDAAIHYFGRAPIELNTIESVYLIRRLPNPVTRHRSYERGKVSKRELASLHRVLLRMLERNRLTKQEYDQALTQEIVFFKEGDPWPSQRRPVVRLVPGDSAFGSIDEAPEGDMGENDEASAETPF